MAGPKFLTGGTSKVFTDDQNASFVGPTQSGTEVSRGVFSQNPGATKKYMLNNGPRDNEYRETMARMFIQMTEQERQLFVDSVKDPVTKKLAQVLAGVGTGGSGGTGFVDFLLTQVNESFSEKAQVTESLSDNFIIYVFGQAAPTFSYAGLLLNTYQDDQRVWMTKLYQEILRGTQLARRRKLLRLRYDSVIVTGLMLNLSMSIVADQEDRVPFSFNFIPTQYVVYTPDLSNPTRLNTGFLPSSALALTTSQAPNTSRLRVAGRAAPPAVASRKRQTDKSYDLQPVSPPTTQNPKADVFPRASSWLNVDEAADTQPTPNVYGGAIPKN